MAAAAQQQAAAALQQAQQQQQQSQQDAPPASATAAASSSSSNEAVTAAAADTSSEVARKIRERFMKDVSKVIVKVLTPFRKETGQIGTGEDFKHLAKKLTNYILTKEMKHCARIEDLKCSDSVKRKAAGFVKKYMSKFNQGYKRSPPQPGSRN